MVVMQYQVILQYEIEFDDKGVIVGRPKLVKGFIPKHLDAKKKEVTRNLYVSSGESVEL